MPVSAGRASPAAPARASGKTPSSATMVPDAFRHTALHKSVLNQQQVS
jgi:hypothetical protein